MTFIIIDVKDGDDLSPIFTRDVYETSVQEDFPVTVRQQFERQILHGRLQCLNVAFLYLL